MVERINCHCYTFQDNQAGVVPRRSFFPKDKENRYFRGVPSARSNGVSSRGNSMNGRQESQYSDESESGEFSLKRNGSCENAFVKYMFVLRSWNFGIFY